MQSPHAPDTVACSLREHYTGHPVLEVQPHDPGGYEATFEYNQVWNTAKLCLGSYGSELATWWRELNSILLKIRNSELTGIIPLPAYRRSAVQIDTRDRKELFASNSHWVVSGTLIHRLFPEALENVLLANIGYRR